MNILNKLTRLLLASSLSTLNWVVWADWETGELGDWGKYYPSLINGQTTSVVAYFTLAFFAIDILSGDKRARAEALTDNFIAG